MIDGRAHMESPNCRECDGSLPEAAESCPRCGALRSDCATIDVWFNGDYMENLAQLEELQAAGWAVVSEIVHSEWVAGFDVDVTTYKLRRTAGPE